MNMHYLYQRKGKVKEICQFILWCFYTRTSDLF